MFEKFLQAIRDPAYFSEQARRNSDELKDLRTKHEETALAVQRLAFEIQRIKENEAHEREKLTLRVENALLKIRDEKNSKSSRSEETSALKFVLTGFENTKYQ